MNWPTTEQRMNVSLVIADVDGTLVTEDKVLTPRAQAAVRALDEAGVAFAVTSGRPPRGMAMLVEPLHLKTPIAAFNGGVFTTPAMETIEEHVLAPDVAGRAAERILQHGLDCWVYSGDDWFVRDLTAAHVAREQRTVKFAPRIVADLGSTLDKAIKLVGVSDDYAAVARCATALQETLRGQASATRSQLYYLDVTHPDANKGTVVATLSKLLSVPQERIATIGDMPNDVLMFRKSGLSIAMANASPPVKAQAHFVTDSYNDEGFAKAMERFVLAPAPVNGGGTR